MQKSDKNVKGKIKAPAEIYYKLKYFISIAKENLNLKNARSSSENKDVTTK
jgi:hypothetical protein